MSNDFNDLEWTAKNLPTTLDEATLDDSRVKKRRRYSQTSDDMLERTKDGTLVTCLVLGPIPGKKIARLFGFCSNHVIPATQPLYRNVDFPSIFRRMYLDDLSQIERVIPFMSRENVDIIVDVVCYSVLSETIFGYS